MSTLVRHGVDRNSSEQRRKVVRGLTIRGMPEAERIVLPRRRRDGLGDRSVHAGSAHPGRVVAGVGADPIYGHKTVRSEDGPPGEVPGLQTAVLQGLVGDRETGGVL